MFSEAKVTEIYCIANDFLQKKSLKCNYFKTKTVRLIKRIFINSKRQRPRQ